VRGEVNIKPHQANFKAFVHKNAKKSEIVGPLQATFPEV